jgi:hypothetical protein
MKRYIFIIVLLPICFIACEKNELRSTETISTDGKAFAKIALLSPNTPSVIMKQNGVKINALTAGFGGIYPATVNFPDYAALAPTGQFQFSLPFIGTGNDSAILFSTQMSLAAERFNSLVVTDTGVDRTLFNIVDEETSLPPDSFYNVRFINAMPKSPNMSLVRIDSTSATSVIRDTIIKDIAYKSASSFVTVPVYGKRISSSGTATHSFVRYRMVNPVTGLSYSQVIPTQTTVMHRRNATFYGSGFASGTGTLSPGLSTNIINK